MLMSDSPPPRRHAVGLAIGLVVLLAMSGVVLRPASRAAQSTPEAIAERIRARVEAMYDGTGALTADGERIYARLTLPRFYVQCQFAPAWMGPRGLRPRANSLLAVLAAASEEGLQPADYHAEWLRTARAELQAVSPTDPGRLAEIDVVLTDAFMLYGSHLLRGHVDPEMLDPNWSIERRAGGAPPAAASGRMAHPSIRLDTATGRCRADGGTAAPTSPRVGRLGYRHHGG